MHILSPPLKGAFRPYATAPAGIGHHPSYRLPGREGGELLIPHVDIIDGGFQPETALPDAGSGLIVPGGFGIIFGRRGVNPLEWLDQIDSQVLHKTVHREVLEYVREYLSIESAGPVAPGCIQIDRQPVGGFVEYRKLGEGYHAGMVQASAVGQLVFLLCLHIGHKAVVESCLAVIVHMPAFIVQAYPCGEKPPPLTQGGLVEYRGIPVPNQEIGQHGNLLIRYGQIAYFFGDVAVGVIQYQAFYPLPPELHRRQRMIQFEESENSGHRLPGGLEVIPAEAEFQGARSAVLLLPQGKYRPGGVILVHMHIVAQPLQRGGKLGTYLLRTVAQAESFHHGKARIAAFIIIGHVVLDTIFVQAVSKASFPGESRVEHIAEIVPLSGRFFPFPAQRESVVGVAEFIFESIGEEAVAVSEDGRECIIAGRGQEAQPQCICGSVFQADGRADGVGRGKGAERKHASHRIPPVEGSLRPAEQGGVPYALPIKIVGILVQDRESIDIEAQDRILHTGAQATQVDGRSQGCSVIRDMEAGDPGRQHIRTIDARRFKGFRT